VFVVTQMHGLGLSRRTRWWLFGVFAVAVLAVYAWRGYGRVDEIVRIPVIEYLVLAVVVLLIWPVARLLGSRRDQKDRATDDEQAPVAG
jgi:hypothetical protein